MIVFARKDRILTEREKSLPYFYSGIDINKFKFYAVPQLLFGSNDFSNISMDAKILYCIMLDKITLSQNNPDRFSDEDGRIYIIYKISEIEKDLQKGHSTISKLLSELVSSGLIEKKKTKTTDRTNRIYVKNFADFEKSDKYIYADIDFDKYLFYMMPKELITNSVYKKLSLTSKVLYMFLLDRVKLSKENQEKYSDEDGRIFVLFSIENIMAKINCSKGTAIKSIKELEKIHLLEKKKLSGFNNVNKYYVLDFAAGNTTEIMSEPAENVEILQRPNFELSNIQNLDLPESNFCTFEHPDFEPANIQILNPNNTYNNNTYNKSSLHQSDQADGFERRFFEAIELSTITSIDETMISERLSEQGKTGSEYTREFNAIKKRCIDEAEFLNGLAKSITRYVNRCSRQATTGSAQINKDEIEEKLLSVDSSLFMMARDRIMEVDKPIKNYGAYAVSVLLDLLDTKELAVTETVKTFRRK